MEPLTAKHGPHQIGCDTCGRTKRNQFAGAEFSPEVRSGGRITIKSHKKRKKETLGIGCSPLSGANRRTKGALLGFMRSDHENDR